MFGKEKGPTRKTHEEHAVEAWRQLRGVASDEALAKANIHAVLAVYKLLEERLPIPDQPPA